MDSLPIRISKIIIKGGPLRDDFVFEPGDVNLIYGHNETGKTFIVESMITMLFKTGKKLWNLRTWEYGGKITVTGLEDKPVNFSKPGRKLEDYWEQGGNAGLPQDFSCLMVVKAGETLLSDDEKDVDGVGRNLLKNVLSGEGLLDNIEKRISPIVRKAELKDGDIKGNNQGDISKRNQLRDQLTSIDKLLEEAAETYTSGEVLRLRKECEYIEGELKKQKKAKRFLAGKLKKKLEELEKDKEKLPDEEEITVLESQVRDYEKLLADTDRKQSKLEELKNAGDDYLWIEKAAENYRELSTSGGTAPKMSLFFGGLAMLVVSAILAVFSLPIPAVISAAVSLGLFLVYYLSFKKAGMATGENRELEKLKEEYLSRFGSGLTNVATLDVKLELLKESHFQAKSLKEEIYKLKAQLLADKLKIEMAMKRSTGSDIEKGERLTVLSALRKERKELDAETHRVDLGLATLDVSEDGYLYEDTGTVWDKQVFDRLNDDLQEKNEQLEKELENTRKVQSQITFLTESGSNEWEELLKGLQEKHDSVVAEYKRTTAGILAGMQVYQVLQEVREEENSRITDGLERQELVEPLYSITRKYKGIRHDPESGLVLTTEEDDEYNLAKISTGAREQVLLALRMGFLSIGMKGQTAFFILDDAFQHSDWPHRGNLIKQIVDLSDRGWQIFYFTMDDHIRDLFKDTCKPLGESFKYKDLSNISAV